MIRKMWPKIVCGDLTIHIWILPISCKMMMGLRKKITGMVDGGP